MTLKEYYSENVKSIGCYCTNYADSNDNNTDCSDDDMTKLGWCTFLYKKLYQNNSFIKTCEK